MQNLHAPILFQHPWLRPPSSIFDAIEQRHAQLLAALMLLRLALFTMALLIGWILQNPMPLFIYTNLIFNSLIYGISRTRHYQLGMWLFIFGQIIFYFASLPFTGLSNMIYMVIALLSVSLFLNVRQMVVYGGLSTIVFLIASELIPLHDHILSQGQINLFVLISVPIVLFVTYIRYLDEEYIRQQHEQLETIQAALAEAQRIARVAYWSQDVGASEFYEASANLPEIFGFQPQQLLTLADYRRVIHPQDNAIMQARLAELLNSAANQSSMEYRVQQPNGEVHYLYTILTIQRNSQGKPYRLKSVTQNITERKHSEVALAKSQAYLQAVLDSSFSGIMAFRSIREANEIIDFEWLLVNKEAENIVGRTQADLLSKRLLVEMPGNRADGLFNLYVNVVKTGIPLNKEHFYDHEGLRTWFHIVAVKLNDGFVATFSDTTSRKQTEEALQQSELQYRLLADNITDLVSLHSPDGHYLYTSPSYEKLLGYTFAELTELDPVSLVHPDDLSHTRDEAHQQVLRGERITHLEYRLQKKDGAYLWVEAFAQPVRNIAGQITHLVSSSRDITARKAAEEALRLSEARFRTMNEFSPLGIYLTDEQGDCTYINPAYTQITGMDFVSAKGQGWNHGIYPEDRPQVFDEWYGFALEGKPFSGIYRYQHLDGKIVWVNVHAAPIVENQKVVGYVGMIEDISKRKALEEQQTKTLQALETANRDLRDFAHVVSHDLKAPLRGISSVAEWLISDYSLHLDAEGQELLQLMSGRVNRMDALISGILKYSKIGRLDEQPGQVDLNAVVKEVAGMLTLRKDIEVKIETPLPVISCDLTRVQQVFQNLIGNAVKFMDKSDGLVRVGCHDEGENWHFYVADNGPGIPERHFERVFQIFQTLTPRDEMESTGIGLSIVKRIVELCGGRVWITSTVGEGSTFHFTVGKRK